MKTLKAIVANYNATSLILRILVGLIVGAVLAVLVPGAGWLEEFGSLFVGALKGIAPVLVFVIVASALAQGTSKLDRRYGTVVWLYMLTTFVAAALRRQPLRSSRAFCFRRPSFWQRLRSRKWCRRALVRC